jgi:hypothetical protein
MWGRQPVVNKCCDPMLKDLDSPDTDLKKTYPVEVISSQETNSNGNFMCERLITP